MSLDEIIQDINKNKKENIIDKGIKNFDIDKIPFSSPRINYMVYGGIPRGRAVEFFGPEESGKTTSALDIVGQAQKKYPDKKVIYVDLENTLDEEWAKINGVNVDELYILQPLDEPAEEILGYIKDIINSRECSVVVLDSIPMLVPKAIHGEDLEKGNYGGVSGILSRWCSEISTPIKRTDTTFIFINQIREDLGNPYNPYRTPGGKHLKHLASMRMYFRKGKFIDENEKEAATKIENPIGQMIDIRLQKTKICKPDRRIGQMTLKYDKGIDDFTDTIFMAQNYGLINQSGSMFYLIDLDTGELGNKELSFRGKGNLMDYLEDNPEYYKRIYEEVNNKASAFS